MTTFINSSVWESKPGSQYWISKRTYSIHFWPSVGLMLSQNGINFSFLPRRSTSGRGMDGQACRLRALWREVLFAWLYLWSFSSLGWHWPRDINLSQYKMWMEVVLLCGVSYVVQSQNKVIVPISSEHLLPFWLWVLMWSRYRTLWSISEFLFIYLPSTQN